MELHVRVVSARNLLDKQTFGKQDPYCKLSLRNKKFKTRVHDNGHKTPVWNERFTFAVVDPQLDQLVLEVKDKNFTSSVLIGECRLPVSMFLHGNVVDQWFPLNNGSKGAGEINLRVQYLGPGVQPSSEVPSKKAAKAQSSQPYPYGQQSVAPGYPAPQQPAYPAPQQSAYPAPQQPAYPAPQQPAYPAPQQHSGYPAAAAPAYPPQQPYYQQPPPQYAQHQQPYYQQPASAYPPSGYHSSAYPHPPPPQVMYVQQPPPGAYGHGHHSSYGYGYGGKHGHKSKGGMGGMSGGQMAMGVGAGVLGGLLLGEALEDVFD